jgi:nicotinate-nucleotide adenylyltransferase
MTVKKKLGFFGGTFDPIHFGHLSIALQLMEHHKLDRVLFCPANRSPFKVDKEALATPLQRQEMVEIAIAPIDRFELLDYEIQKDGPSYTVDTLRYLKEKFKDAELFIILAEDLLIDFHLWKEHAEILKLARPLVGGRGIRFEREKSALSKEELDKLEAGKMKIFEMEISSTYIRQRLKKRVYCGHLVPSKVLDYIYEHRLY